LTWAENAYDIFEAARIKQSAEIGEKNEAFQSSQEADSLLGERYQILKDILISRYSLEDDKLKIYGIDGRTARNHAERIHVSEDFIEGHIRLKAAADPNVLPDIMITNFTALVDEARQKYYEAGLEREEAQKATEELNNIYNNDSIKLRAIYNWIIAYWGKFDTRLITLGFVQASNISSGNLPIAPINLNYNYLIHVLSWDSVTDATSYQAVRQQSGSTDWEEFYSGADLTYQYIPSFGDYTIKIRARNSNGYGDWSMPLNVHFEAQP
jgi:hypothetical protein